MNGKDLSLAETVQGALKPRAFNEREEGFCLQKLGAWYVSDNEPESLDAGLYTGVAPFMESFKTHGLAEEGGSPQLTGCRGYGRDWNPLLPPL